MKTIKLYRFVARNCYQKKMHGILRGLNYEKAKIPDGEYEMVLGFLNENLKVPNSEHFRKSVNSFKEKRTLNIPVEFWFTETGYAKFGNTMENLINLYFQYAPNYIKEWDILELEILPTDERILYSDVYQLALSC